VGDRIDPDRQRVIGSGGGCRGLGQAVRAVQLWGAAEALRELSGATLSLFDCARYDSMATALHAQIDKAAWNAAWAVGRAMPLEQIVGYALEVETSDTRVPVSVASSR
jgi:hypothetical protein